MNDSPNWSSTKWLLASLSPYREIGQLQHDHYVWSRIFKTADEGLVLPRLALKLADHSETLPTEVNDFLNIALELNRLRNSRLQNQLVTLLKNLNASGVVPVVMKGAVQLLDPRFDIGARVMLDIDIWAQNAVDQQTAMSCLLRLGYQMRGTMQEYEQHQHFPPFFHDGELARIELHRSMVRRTYTVIVDEVAVASRLTEQSFMGVKFLILNDIDAIKLSYIQCRSACEGGYVTMMKWLDLLDRCKMAGINEVSGPWDFGMRTNGDAVDTQFLTGLNELCGFPYSGLRDREFVEKWEKAQYDPFGLQFARKLLSAILGNALDPAKWRGRTPADVRDAFMFRLRNLPESYKLARSKNRH
jgi:hypothetical protein